MSKLGHLHVERYIAFHWWRLEKNSEWILLTFFIKSKYEIDISLFFIKIIEICRLLKNLQYFSAYFLNIPRMYAMYTKQS